MTKALMYQQMRKRPNARTPSLLRRDLDTVAGCTPPITAPQLETCVTSNESDEPDLRTQLERTVVGTAMAFPRQYPSLAAIVTPDMFKHAPAQIMWDELAKRIPAGLPVDENAMAVALGRDKLRRVGGNAGPSSFTLNPAPVADWHADRLRRIHLRELAKQELYRSIQQIDKDEEDDIAHSIDDILQRVTALHQQAAEAGVTAHQARRMILTPASEIPIRRTRWLWDTTPEGQPPTSHGRIPMYSLTIAAGGAGIGKSQFAGWLAAHVTKGTLPGELNGKPRCVIYAATEDSWSQTIAPRLIAAGADMGRVFRVEVVDDGAKSARLTLPVDTSLLGRTAEEYGVALFVADPLLSMIDANINDYRAAEVRAALEPLVDAADRHAFTVLGLAHFTKNGAADPLLRIAGSGAFGQLIRALIAFARVEDETGDPEFVLSIEKNNLGREGLPSFKYSIQGCAVDTVDDGPSYVSRFVLGPESTTSVKEQMVNGMQPAGDQEAASEAADWLREFLTDFAGCETADVIKAAARKAGLSDSSVDRAKKKLGLKTKQTGFGKEKRSLWALPGVDLDGK